MAQAGDPQNEKPLSKLEEHFRASDEVFRLLVHSVRDYAIFLLDPLGRVASWNEGAERIKGYRAEEIIGRHFSVFYPEEDIQSGKCEWELEEATRTGRFEDEGWRVRKDGAMFWANVVITAVKDEKRRLLGFAKVTRDLTERKRAEDRLQRAYGELERRVETRTKELQAANESLARREEELREAIRVRDEFLSIASHELKTPITSIRMQLQMLQSRVDPPRSELPPLERLQRFTGATIRSVDRLTQLVEDLLDVARAQSKKLAFHFEETELRSLAEEVLERLKPQADAAGCRLACDAPEAVPGRFDRFRLDQLMVNLLSNAIKYAPGAQVELRLRTEGQRAIIEVRDEGPGVPDEARSRLFERFERGTNARNVAGLGLGLYIVRQIVQGHGGSIHLESAPGKGAVFRVELPRDGSGKASGP